MSKQLKDVKGFPELEIHTHNSIPCHFDGLDEGCCICQKNQALSQIGELRVVIDDSVISALLRKSGKAISEYKSTEEVLAEFVKDLKSSSDVLVIKGGE